MIRDKLRWGFKSGLKKAGWFFFFMESTKKADYFLCCCFLSVQGEERRKIRNAWDEMLWFKKKIVLHVVE